MQLGIVHKRRHGLRVRGQWFYDDITMALVIKSVTIGIKMCLNLRDVIYALAFSASTTSRNRLSFLNDQTRAARLIFAQKTRMDFRKDQIKPVLSSIKYL